MNISNEIKKILIDNDLTLTQLAKVIEKKKGKNFSVQNLSQKLKFSTLTVKELEIILEYLNYDLKLSPGKKFIKGLSH